MLTDETAAAIDLVGRTGARELQVGYLHDGVPVEQADWYAHAQYRGARITAEHHTGPAQALVALARRLLEGAKCTHCGGLIALSDAGAAFRPGHLIDGSPWDEATVRKAGLCRWRRVGDRWEMGCQP
jgi:hypothetical protein